MNKEDLKVGMIIDYVGDHSKVEEKPVDRKVTAIGDDVYLYKNKDGFSENVDYLVCLNTWQPKAKKKKITMYRHTYYLKHLNKYYQTEWQSVKDCTNNAAATETKEVWVDDGK